MYILLKLFNKLFLNWSNVGDVNVGEVILLLVKIELLVFVLKVSGFDL